MNTSAVTSFFFSSEQYPPTPELITYLENGLSTLIEENEVISSATIYATASNTFITSKSKDDSSTDNLNTMLERMIYSYNSSTLDKNKVQGKGFNTFLFKYENYVVFSKDLTTLSGSSYSTMFFLLNPEAFSSFIYKANEMIPYNVSIYDAHNELLFSNSKRDARSRYTQLLNFTAGDAPKANQAGYIYCRSDVTGMQYLLEMKLIPLPNESSVSPLLYLSVTFSGVLLISLFYFALHNRLGGSFAKLEKALGMIGGTDPCSVSAFADHMEQQFLTLSRENAALKETIQVTSSEALAHLFAKIIGGEAVDKEEVNITLENTGHGFCLSDIYIAGILHQTVTNFITAASRQRVLNMLNSVFERFMEKKQCNLCAFLYDEKSFVIIASFPAGTSIAKGKTRINELTQQINEGITFLGIPMSAAFGHMYNSILDLSFSYNEAFKAMHYQTEAAAPHTAPSIAYLSNTFAMGTPASSPEPSEGTPDVIVQKETADPSEQLERRAAQIAQLVWDEKDDQLPSLINRTLAIIFDPDGPPRTAPERQQLCKLLISAVTNHILSYPFVNDSHLSSVPEELLFQTEISAEEQPETLRRALDTLCSDFSSAVKKLRNPYIVAAQEYIEQNYQNPYLSLEEIAESLKIAPNYLSTIFSKNLGIKLFEYVNEQRLEKSIHLLLETNKTVNEISLECGFGSSRNYIRIFKKYKDNTPGAYRKQYSTQPALHSHSEGDS